MFIKDEKRNEEIEFVDNTIDNDFAEYFQRHFPEIFMKKAIVIITIFILLFNIAGVVYANQIEDITEIVNSKEILEIENIMQDYRNVDSNIYKKDIVDKIFEIEDSVIRQDLLSKLDTIDEQRDEELLNKFLEESKKELEMIERNKKIDLWIGIFAIIMTFVFLLVAEITLI